MTNPYSSILELCTRHRLVLPRPDPWWLLDADVLPYGHVNGVPSISGRAVATNGILYVIVTPKDDVLIGHREWFVRHRQEVGTRKRQERLVNKYV